MTSALCYGTWGAIVCEVKVKQENQMMDEIVLKSHVFENIGENLQITHTFSSKQFLSFSYFLLYVTQQISNESGLSEVGDISQKKKGKA